MAVGVIHRDPSISRSWLRGAPLDPSTTRNDLEQVVEELEAAGEALSAESAALNMYRG